MKVKFLTRSAGPGGAIMPGNIVDVPEKEAELLVRGRYAVYMENPPPTDEPPTDEPPSEEPSTGKKKTGHAAKK